MNNVALDPNAGKPMAGDLVWSALPDAPVEVDRAPRLLVRLVRRLSHRQAARARASAAQHARVSAPAFPDRRGDVRSGGRSVA